MHDRAMPAWTASLLRALLLGTAYLAAMATAILYSRFDGSVATVWVANALLLAELVGTRPRRWPAPLAACGLAGALLVLWLGLGWGHALALVVATLGEAVVAALLIRRWAGALRLDSVRSVVVLVVSAGIIAPAISAVVAAVWLLDGPFVHDALVWYAGHAAGTIAFAPLIALTLGRKSHGSRRRASWARRGEAILMSAVMIGVSIGVFSQERLPLLSLPILPLVWCTLRFGRLGAASGIVALASAGAVLTARQHGPISLIQESLGFRALFLQFYLALAALIVLPLAAVLRQRFELFTRLQQSEARFRLLADQVGDAILLIEPDGRVTYASPAVATLGGYDPEALVGSRVHELVVEDDLEAVVGTHRRALAHPGATHAVEYRARAADGGERWFETRTRAYCDEAGRVAGVVSGIRDVSQRKAIEAELAAAARSDTLTGLPNRRVFDERLAGLCAGHRAADRRGCVAVLDVDHFKAVNDRHGHDGGDAVLVAIGRIARDTLRDRDLFARVGGEEFGMLLDADPADALRACERLRKAIAARPVETSSGPVTVTVSIGIARITPGGAPAALLRLADQALYRAKERGRDRVEAAWPIATRRQAAA